MGLVGNILIVIVILIICYFVYSLFFRKTKTLTHMNRADTKAVVVKHKNLPHNNSSDFTYSIWFFIDDWNINYGEYKNILWQGGSNPDIAISLDKYENDLKIVIESYTNTEQISQYDNQYRSQKKVLDDITADSFTIPNVPLQKWVNLITSINGRTMDVYLDGKLVKTYILPGVAKTDSNADILVGNYQPYLKGFSGWTSKLQYMAHASNPQEAYDIYKKGPTSNFFGSVFNKYRIKFAFLEYDTEKASVEI